MGPKVKIAAALAVSLVVTVSAGTGSASGSGGGNTSRAAHGKPTAIKLQKGKPFHGDLLSLPAGTPTKRERPEPELPAKPPPLYGLGAPVGSGLAPGSLAPAPSPTASFDGLNFVNNGSGWPPDPNGDVGPTYYIQAVNTSIGIYDKSTDAQVVAFTFDTFMGGHFPNGNLCNNANGGDPIVVYDTFHDRWVITDLAYQTTANGTIDSSAGSYECIAVSQSGDPVSGGWNFYSLHLTDGLQDYPKFGIWPDGLYMSANMFNFNLNQFLGPRVWALDLASMEAGANATAVQFDASTSYSSLLPANARLQTGTPPAGSPNYYASLSDSGSVEVWKFHVDWATPSNSTFTGPGVAAAPAWLDPPDTAAEPDGNAIDTLGDRAMMQNQYTNIGGHESLWDTRTVQGSSASQAAVAWFQTDVTGGTVASTTTQASTWNPDSSNRFLPSLAVDRLGDMAIGYTVSSSTTDPAIRYAARLAGDPLNTLSLTETSLIDGTGWQSSLLTSRWGDYSAMTLDPTNGCTFWYTNEYYASNGASWLTRIGSFTLPGCTGPAPPTASNETAATKEGAAVPITLQGSSSSVCDLAFSIASGPAHGALGSITDHPCTSGSPNTDTATITYTPASGYTGPDSFTYKVNDGTADSNTATVTLAVNPATGYPASILADSPAAYWRLDESSGTSMADSSGNGLAGSYVGNPTLGVSGLVGGDSAVSFNGSSQYAQVPYSAALNPASSFSVEAWAKLSGGSGYRSVITSRGQYTGYAIYAGSNGHWQLQLGTGSKWYALSGPAVATNVSTYLVATYNGTTAKLYVNGTLAASGTPGKYVPNTSKPLRLAAGATETSPTYYFPGILDETALYPTALTATQIQTHYAAASS